MLSDIKENQGIDMLQHLLSGYGRKKTIVSTIGFERCVILPKAKCKLDWQVETMAISNLDLNSAYNP